MKAALLALILAVDAGTEKPVAIAVDRPSTLVLDTGKQLDLPPGVFLPRPAFDAVDAEVRRLQSEASKPCESPVVEDAGLLFPAVLGFSLGVLTVGAIVYFAKK